MKRLVKKAINFTNISEEQKQSMIEGLKNVVMNGQMSSVPIKTMSMMNEVNCTIQIDESFDVASWNFCAAFEQLCLNDESIRNKIKEVYLTSLQQVTNEQSQELSMSLEQYSKIFNDTLDDRLKYSYAGIQPNSKIYNGSSSFEFTINIPSVVSAMK